MIKFKIDLLNNVFCIRAKKLKRVEEILARRILLEKNLDQMLFNIVALTKHVEHCQHVIKVTDNIELQDYAILKMNYLYYVSQNGVSKDL